MRIYTVGGAVRDELMGLPVKDRDHVVVGATPAELAALGYIPVGRDFPVFLHPASHEEYALARTERKTAPGYAGFTFHAAPDITLEQDLARRDLTINAIARDEHGTLIDPHGGVRDIAARMLRHVGPAFIEDPVRVLRVARFAARFGFDIAPETRALMRAMADNGEVDALVPERVWQELARGLMEARPSRMLEVLSECGALPRVAPELAVPAVAAMYPALDAAAGGHAPLEVRCAVLARGLNAAAVEALSRRLKLPAEVRDLCRLASLHAARIAAGGPADAAGLLALFDAADAWRRPERYNQLLEAALAGAAPEQAAAVRTRQRAALAAALAVDAGTLARAASGVEAIRIAITGARRDAISRVLER